MITSTVDVILHINLNESLTEFVSTCKKTFTIAYHNFFSDDERKEHDMHVLNRSHSEVLLHVDCDNNVTPIPGDLNKPPSKRMHKFLSVIFKVMRIRDSG